MYDNCKGGAHGQHAVLSPMTRSATMVCSTRLAVMLHAPPAVPSGGEEYD